VLSLAILQETAGATSAPTTAGNWLSSGLVIGTLLVIPILVVALVIAIWGPPDWEWIPGGKPTIRISAIVIVILAVIIGLSYLVPGVASILASVLGSVGPTVAALITALLAFLGVVLAQIVTVLVFGIGRLLDLRSNQERAEEEQPRETVRAEEEQPREPRRAQEDILDRSLDRITDLVRLTKPGSG